MTKTTKRSEIISGKKARTELEALIKRAGGVRALARISGGVTASQISRGRTSPLIEPRVQTLLGLQEQDRRYIRVGKPPC